jgi:hypothetical protein
VRARLARILAALVAAGALLAAQPVAPLPDQTCYRPADVPALSRRELRTVYRCLDAAGWTHGR